MGLEAWDIKRLNSHLWNIQVILWHSTCIIPLQCFTMFMYWLYIILQHSTMMSRLLAPLLLFYSFCPPYQIWCWSWPLKTGSLTWKIVFTASLNTSTNTLSTYGGNFSVTHSNATWKAIFWRPFFIRQNAPSFSHVA